MWFYVLVLAGVFGAIALYTDKVVCIEREPEYFWYRFVIAMTMFAAVTMLGVIGVHTESLPHLSMPVFLACLAGIPYAVVKSILFRRRYILASA